jgi:thiopurine S-methyltransferase
LEQQFWHQIWENNTIGFHQTDHHPWLEQIVKLKSNDDLFVPLCGKSLDMWPLSGHYRRLIGAELSDIACEDFFKDAGIVPNVAIEAEHRRYQTKTADYEIKLWQGDYFSLSSHQISDADRLDVFDRAAMVALPDQMRLPYVQQLRSLCKHATLFILTLEFDQQQLSGPPFALDDAMIHEYFSFASSIKKIATRPLSDKIFAQRKLRVDELAESLYVIKW